MQWNLLNICYNQEITLLRINAHLKHSSVWETDKNLTSKILLKNKYDEKNNAEKKERIMTEHGEGTQGVPVEWFECHI